MNNAEKTKKDELTVFEFESNPVTVVAGENGEPWFVASEVCDVLGISKHRDAVARLDDDEKSTRPLRLDGWSQARAVAVVNEPGLYTLILGSQKPEAKAFKRWVTHDVLPTLRKNGRYETPAAPPKEDKLALAWERERRLMRVVEMQERKLAADSLTRLASKLAESGLVSKEQIAALEVKAAEAGAQFDGTKLLPVDKTPDWLAPAAIGELLGVSSAMVGRVVTALDLRGNKDGLARAVHNVAPGTHKEVTSYQYSPAAVERIRVELERRGKLSLVAEDDVGE